MCDLCDEYGAHGIIEHLHRKKKPKTPAKPVKKLYCVTSSNLEEYISALDEKAAVQAFIQIHSRFKDYKGPAPIANRIKPEWDIRFPLIWRRIGLEAEKRQHEQYLLWIPGWVKMWADIGIAMENDCARFFYLEID